MSSDYPDNCLLNQGTGPDETVWAMDCREVSGEIVMSIQDVDKQAVQKFEHEKK